MSDAKGEGFVRIERLAQHCHVLLRKRSNSVVIRNTAHKSLRLCW
jgi:hypothetical protein